MTALKRARSLFTRWAGEAGLTDAHTRGGALTVAVTVVFANWQLTTCTLPPTKAGAIARLSALATTTALHWAHILCATNTSMILVTLTLTRSHALSVLASITDCSFAAESTVSSVALACTIILTCSVLAALKRTSPLLAVGAVVTRIAHAVTRRVLAITTRLSTTIRTALLMTKRRHKTRRAFTNTRGNRMTHCTTFGRTFGTVQTTPSRIALANTGCDTLAVTRTVGGANGGHALITRPAHSADTDTVLIALAMVRALTDGLRTLVTAVALRALAGSRGNAFADTRAVTGANRGPACLTFPAGEA